MVPRAAPIVALLFVAAACGGSSETEASMTPPPTPAATPAPVPATTAPPPTSLPPEPTPPLTTAAAATTTAVTPTAPPPTTAAPTSTTTAPSDPDLLPVAVLAWGLFCRDLEPRGYSYADAVEYWVLEGKPQRMDADRNDIPCETVYPTGEVSAFWAAPPAWTIGPGSSWKISSYIPAATPACCDSNHTGPTSPDLPSETGPFSDDGAYHVWVERVAGDPTRLLLSIRRWVNCSVAPDLCNPPYATNDVGIDDSSEVIRSLALDGDLTVVVNAIPTGDGVDWLENRIEGDGYAFARLLLRMDAAFEQVVVPAFEAEVDAWTAETDLMEMGAEDRTFPFGPVEEEGLLAYRGPSDTLLTTWAFYAMFGGYDDLGIWGWWTTLEIVDGKPVLFVQAGQIAG